MAGELAFAWWFVGIETIDIFKVRRRGVEANAIDAQMPVIANLHLFAGLDDHSLDVKLILRHLGMIDSLGLEHDDFAARRLAEIVSQTITNK